MAKNIAEIPAFLVISVCYFFIIYTNSHQIDDTKRKMGFLLVLIIGGLCAQGLGFFIGIAANKSFKLAVVADLGVIVTNILFAGIFTPLREIPGPVKWMEHCSFIKQVFHLHLQLIYAWDRCPEGTVPSLLYQNNLTDENKFWVNLPALITNTLVLRGMAFVALYTKTNGINLRYVFRSRGNGSEKQLDSIDTSVYM